MELGIDRGGTKIEAVVMHQGAVLARRRIPTPAGDYAATLRALSGLVAALESECAAPDLPVGLGHPGSETPGSGALRNANSTCLNGRPLRSDLERLLGRPIAMGNDANCMALSEARDGAGAGYSSVFGVILGTGVGGAVVIDGQVIFGANDLAGEWGHNPLPWMTADELAVAKACWCGQSQCLETWLSGPALAQDHQRQGGARLSAEAIAQAALRGDATAGACLERYSHRLARALAAVINLLDPAVIVLAGGLSQIDMLYARVPEIWQHWIFADHVETLLLPAQHGDASGVRGAALLAAQAANIA